MLLPCIRDVIEVLKNMKYSVEKKDLDVSLPFYTANRAFYEDDTEEMNFQIAYHKFVLDAQFGEFKIENSEATISLLKQFAGTIFAKENMCVVIVGNTKGITKKIVKEGINFGE